MKKIYISPIARTIDIEAETLIASSPGPMGLNENPGDEDGGCSNRRNSIWGDEY